MHSRNEHAEERMIFANFSVARCDQTVLDSRDWMCCKLICVVQGALTNFIFIPTLLVQDASAVLEVRSNFGA